MRKLVFGLLILTSQVFIIGEVQAQNMIGMDKEEIMEEMNTRFKTFKLNTSTVNHAYKYLKYEDSINEITILFFLSDNDKCTLIRKMYDYSNINEVLMDLNDNYKSSGKNQWTYADRGQQFQLDLSEGEWFFTITVKPKE